MIVELSFPAVRVRQPGRDVFMFAASAAELRSMTTVSRARRAGRTRSLEGYQRPEVRAHIRQIREYLKSGSAFVPNALSIAFEPRVRFEASAPDTDQDRVPGLLYVPLDPSGHDSLKPGWIVDGQQRVAALDAPDVADFPLCAVGFIRRDEAEEREQFVRVNATKPLPRGLIHELLPTIDGPLPASLARKLVPAQLVELLNARAGSPFFNQIQTPTCPDGIIKDTSVLKMIEASMSDGALFQYRATESGCWDIDGMLEHLQQFWTQVALTFPEAWNLPPSRSRLTHGAGIAGMGLVMDLWTEQTPAAALQPDKLRDLLARLSGACAWTEGAWSFVDGSSTPWNGLQNTGSDIRLLAHHLRLAASTV